MWLIFLLHSSHVLSQSNSDLSKHQRNTGLRVLAFVSAVAAPVYFGSNSTSSSFKFLAASLRGTSNVASVASVISESILSDCSDEGPKDRDLIHCLVKNAKSEDNAYAKRSFINKNVAADGCLADGILNELTDYPGLHT